MPFYVGVNCCSSENVLFIRRDVEVCATWLQVSIIIDALLNFDYHHNSL